MINMEDKTIKPNDVHLSLIQKLFLILIQILIMLKFISILRIHANIQNLLMKLKDLFYLNNRKRQRIIMVSIK